MGWYMVVVCGVSKTELGQVQLRVRKLILGIIKKAESLFDGGL